MYKSNKDKVLKAITDAEYRALETIGIFGEAESKLRTAVDTGTLKRSITHQVNDGEKCVAIGTPVIYAPCVEKGTSKQKAQPFITPAIEENRDKIKEIVQQALGKVGE